MVGPVPGDDWDDPVIIVRDERRGGRAWNVFTAHDMT